jgi:cold shock CspA family protein/ribosome-associated translation inhibitor RaiA
MQTSLQISFHQVPPSPALEDDVRRWVDELETFFDRMISCRVLIEAPHHHQHQGGLYRVRIEIGVPGDQLVVTRSPDEHAAHEDAHVAVRDAFREARRELEDYARRMRHDVKKHIGPPHGRVVHLEPNLEYGRIATDDGRDIYFHRNSVIGGIERLRLDTEVRFHEEAGDHGPQASTVEPVGEHGHYTQ